MFKASQRFFKTYGIELEIEDEAVHRVADEAAKSKRIGARALKAVWGRIIKPFEFDPFAQDRVKQEGDVHRLVVDKSMVMESLRGTPV